MLRIPDETAIRQLDDVHGALRRLGGDADLELDLAHFVVDLARADVELHVELRLLVPLEAFRRLRVLDRQVLDVLLQDSGDRLRVGAVAARGVGIEVGEDVAFFGHWLLLSDKERFEAWPAR
jgi:hypothetical protein